MFISVQPRDVTLSFHNSCNCCSRCLKAQLEPNDKVYINSKGKVERFKEKKAKDISESFKRSTNHLNIELGKRLAITDDNDCSFGRDLKRITDSIEITSTIKVVHIDNINKIMLDKLNAVNNATTSYEFN